MSRVHAQMEEIAKVKVKLTRLKLKLEKLTDHLLFLSNFNLSS